MIGGKHGLYNDISSSLFLLHALVAVAFTFSSLTICMKLTAMCGGRGVALVIGVIFHISFDIYTNVCI